MPVYPGALRFADYTFLIRRSTIAAILTHGREM
jgi:hypothetical protein